jgi:hypothetical protein
VGAFDDFVTARQSTKSFLVYCKVNLPIRLSVHLRD